MATGSEGMAYKCPRCCGFLVVTDPGEPYCLMCGHRTAWSNRPSELGSSHDYGIRISNPRYREADGLTGGGRPPTKGWQTREATVGLPDGRRLRIRYVHLTGRKAECEGVDWERGPYYLTGRLLKEVRRLFLDKTGLNLIGLGDSVTGRGHMAPS